VSLIRLFRTALDDLGIDGKLVTADIRPDIPARFTGDIHELTPRVDQVNYIDSLLGTCERLEIALLVPLIDPELHLLAQHRERFTALGVEVLISAPGVTEISFDKRNTSAFFREADVLTPDDYCIEDVEAEKCSFPLLLKPARGSGSIGVVKLQDMNEFRFFVSRTPDPLVQEFVEGAEYTVDVLADFSGKPRSVVPRLRMQTRAGEVSKGITAKHRELIEQAVHVVDSLPGARGPITLQCFLTGAGEIKFIEINPRFGGGFPLSAAAGANFPRWIIEWVRGLDPHIELIGWEDELMMFRFDDAMMIPKHKVFRP